MIVKVKETAIKRMCHVTPRNQVVFYLFYTWAPDPATDPKAFNRQQLRWAIAYENSLRMMMGRLPPTCPHVQRSQVAWQSKPAMHSLEKSPRGAVGILLAGVPGVCPGKGYHYWAADFVGGKTPARIALGGRGQM